MPYRVPGAYARFVRTAGPVNNPGATRIMALVGTGLNYYEVYNEPIKKLSDRPYEQLANSNVFEIINCSSKPVFTGKNTPDNVFYKAGVGFEVKESKYIAWNTLDKKPAEVVAESIGLEGSIKFKQQVNVVVDPNSEYLVEDGEFVVEITYIEDSMSHSDIGHKPSGAYRVINNVTKEIVGEYGVSTVANVNAIPGVKLTISDVFIADTDGESVTKVGDYVIVKTTAGKTEVEPSISFDDTVASFSADLKAAIKSLMVVDSTNVVEGQYDLVITDITTQKFTITAVGGTTPLYSGVIGAMGEYLEIIPGITFVFNKMPTNAVNGDTIRIVTKARVGDATVCPAEGATYYVSYKYRKAVEDYDPQIFFDYDDVVDEYGNYDVTASSVVINSLSLGAEIAFQQGVSTIICVQSKNDSDYEMKLAIDKLQRTLPGVTNVNTVIPLTESPEVGAYAMKHIDIMSSYEHGKERMLYLGAYKNQPITKNPTALDRSIGMVETAKSYNNERVVFVTPGEVVREVKDLRTGRINDRVLPSVYAAIAVASLGLVNDPAEPLTNKTIGGFKYLQKMMMESEMNLLAEAGCLVLQQKGSNIKVRHGITTSPIDVNSTEITLIQIKDFVIEAVRTSCGNLYVGQKNLPSILADVQYTITSILNQFISQQIIMSFQGLTVKRSKDDPRQIDVRFDIEAVYPLNYINIQFGFAAVS
jgi:hypothetical protein